MRLPTRTLRQCVGAAFFALLLAGCPSLGDGDYFHIEIGNSWEYRVTEGGETGERWYLDALDADDNDESSRGETYFRLRRVYPNPDGPELPAYDIPMRRFNISVEEDGAGTRLGFVYKFAFDDEGRRNEYFLHEPGPEADWSTTWDFEVQEEDTNTLISYDISARRSSDPVQTSFGTFTDNVEVVRTVTTDLNDGEQVITQSRTETWANGYGLVRYRVDGADGGTAGRLFTTNVAERPGS